jgi:hypothetical protein
MKSCTLCSHAQRTEIDQELVSGTSLRNIAERYGTSATALHRHKQHLSSHLAKAREAAQVVDAGTLLDQVKSLLSQAQRITEQAQQSKKLTVALQGIREVRGVLELLGKLSGELQTGTRIGIGINGRPVDPEQQLRDILDGIMAEGDDLEPMVQGFSDKQLNGMIEILGPEANA